MPPTLIATPGAIDANTYCTLSESNTYHDAHVYGSTWLDGDDDAKKQALVWATRLLDEQVDWSGVKNSVTQALRWPRSYVTDRDGFVIDSATIPTWLKNATAELARYLIQEDRTVERSFGLESVTADTVEVVFKSSDVKPILPVSVLSMISGYGNARAASGVVKLERV